MQVTIVIPVFRIPVHPLKSHGRRMSFCKGKTNVIVSSEKIAVPKNKGTPPQLPNAGTELMGGKGSRKM